MKLLRVNVLLGFVWVLIWRFVVQPLLLGWTFTWRNVAQPVLLGLFWQPQAKIMVRLSSTCIVSHAVAVCLCSTKATVQRTHDVAPSY
jgi:hypothetical protein